MNKAKAAVFVGINKPFEVKEYELTTPIEEMARVELIASGICGTDIHIHGGKIELGAPMIIGHEFVGRVDELSQQDSSKYHIEKGDNVIVSVASPCGECILCKNGDDANCLNMGVTYFHNPCDEPHLFGGYSEYNYSPVKNLIKIPSELEPKMVCVFACAGPTALHAFTLAERANCHVENANVAVVQGLGPVGMFAVMHLASLGIKHIVSITSGKNLAREELAIKLGSTEVLSLDKMSTQEITKYVRDLNGGIGADVIFEASGNPTAFVQGMEMMRNRGVYLVPGQYSNSGKVEIAPQMITFNALHIIGSSQYATSDIKTYLSFLLKNPQLHASILELAKCYHIDNINNAIDDAKCGRNIKTMLVK